jgi:ABC-2 type transport system ATP-binding protein
MEIGEQMLYLAQLKGLSKSEAIKRIKFWFEKMGMQDWWKKKVEDLSKGMQQKVQFVATVLHEPELIILDEPFSGFDPINAEIIKDEILELNKKGSTIIFSTHRMESVELLCDHIALIHKSHKILDGSVKSIKDAYRNNTFHLKINRPFDLATVKTFELLNASQIDEGEQLTIKLLNGFTTNDVLQELIPKTGILFLDEVIPSINEIFIQKVKQLN